MAVATQQAMYQQNGAPSLLAAFPQTGTALNLDLIQIVTLSGSILLNVDKNGVVHNPAVNPTTTVLGVGAARVGVFATRLTSSATTAQLFADAFSNPSLNDILQVVNEGGNISYWLSATGVATGS